MIEPARLLWRDDQPYSEAFQDIYHSEDGPGEVARVFLAPTGLAALARPGARLLIGELGFGTGLNFAMAARVCLDQGARLHFVSFEAAPLDQTDFARVARQHGAALPIYRELNTAYPPLIPGWHRRYLAGGRIVVSLFWGDAQLGLADIAARQRRPFHAWFLDGFAPDRNPAMWTPGLMRSIGSLSGADTRVATFTAAGRVRRALQDAGFAMRRVDQLPHKRESLAGTYAGHAPRADTSAGAPAVTVVGAGLAGASSARHLADAGLRVTVLEAADRVASGASGIPSAVLHGRLLAGDGPAAALRCHSYLYSAAYHAQLTARASEGPLSGRQAGVLQLPGANLSPERLSAIADQYVASGRWLEQLSAAAASELARWPLTGGALWFRDAVAVAPLGLCELLLDHPAIELATNRPLTNLATAAESGPVVLACGAATRDFPETRYLEVAPVAGQLDRIRLANQPRLPIVGSGYLVPGPDHLTVGATYEYEDWDPAAASAANLKQLGNREFEWLGRARGVRAVASDRTPVVGQLAALNGTSVSNVYVSAGHGSAGTVTSHFAATLLVELLGGDFAAMTEPLIDLMSPARFRRRQALRGYRQGAEP